MTNSSIIVIILLAIVSFGMGGLVHEMNQHEFVFVLNSDEWTCTSTRLADNNQEVCESYVRD